VIVKRLANVLKRKFNVTLVDKMVLSQEDQLQNAGRVNAVVLIFCDWSGTVRLFAYLCFHVGAVGIHKSVNNAYCAVTFTRSM